MLEGTEVDFLSAEILRVHPDEPQPDLVDYIVSSLRKGEVIAMPTDTFYGLAVDPVNLHAVERIYQIKTRQKHKPLSLLISSLAQAYELARDTDQGPIHLDVVAPVPALGGLGNERLGAIVLRIDPRRFLYPLISAWPTPSASA